MIHLCMIFYDERTEGLIPDGFVGLSNTSPDRPDLFEIEPILKYLGESEIKDDDYYGFFSPRFFEKTGLNHSDIREIKNSEIENFDIVSLSSGPIYLSDFNNPVIQADRSHRDFTERFNALFSRIDQNNSLKCAEFSESKIPQKYFLLSHYFIARGAFWKIWANYIASALAEESHDKELRAMLDEHCRYPDRAGRYTYRIFVLERLAGLLAYSHRLKVYESLLTERCLFDFKIIKPTPRWLAALANPLFQIEEKLRGSQTIPRSSVRALSFIRDAQIWLNRMIALATLPK